MNYCGVLRKIKLSGMSQRLLKLSGGLPSYMVIRYFIVWCLGQGVSYRFGGVGFGA